MEFLTLIEGGDDGVLAVFVNEYEKQFYFDLQALRLLRKLRCVDENKLNNIIRAYKKAQKGEIEVQAIQLSYPEQLALDFETRQVE